MNRLPTTASLSSKHTARGAIPQPAPRPASPPVRAGFTLVEMLVAVALVILMMTLFASIFQLATGAMGTQRGLAENDQRSRLVLNSLRYDLNHRTMQYVLPFAANEDVSQPEAKLALRRGYFYIREGDPDDTADDMLQFTIDVKSDDRIYGVWGKRISASGQLGDLLMVDANDKFGDTTNNPYWLNQPEFDDGTNDIDHATSSTLAEVSYFLRNGGLYRRVVLIRQPSTSTGTGSGQPTGTQGPLKTDLFQKNGYSGEYENFWACSDFSAFFDVTNESLKFHGSASLDNSGGESQSVLSIPKFRFGHSVVTGLPREVSTNGYYFGRFTHEETSKFDPSDRSKGFGYPGRITNNSPDPFNTNTVVTYDVNKGVVTEYAGGWRVAEDLLMTNVHRFDIKVWDGAASTGPDGKAGRANVDDDGNGITDLLGANPDPGELGYPGSDDGDFRDIGYKVKISAITGKADPGFYSAPAVANSSYSPPGQYRFDTWHPRIDMNVLNGDKILDRPPYRAALPGADGRAGIAGYSDDGNLNVSASPPNPVVDDANELGWPGSDDIPLPLRAIQIKITFFDPATRLLRDVTLIVPFLD